MAKFSKASDISSDENKSIILKITNCKAFGKCFANIKTGSYHEVVDPPEIYANKYPNNSYTGYWVMGIGEPVRLLPGEYEIVV